MLSLKPRLNAALISVLTLTLTGFSAFAAVPSVQASVRYVPPPDRGTPPSERGTGSRGDCVYREELPPMAALVGEPHLSLTVSDRPTLWAYLPYTSSDASHAEVILQTESSDQEIYRGFFPLSDALGVTGIRFPMSMPALEVGETYRWYIDVACSPGTRAPETRAPQTGITESSTYTPLATPATLTGVVERVVPSPELTQALNIATTPVETLAVYGDYHLWYDLLNDVASRRLSAADSQFEQLWIDLLSDEAGANLGTYSEAPLVGKVTAQDASNSL